jgi:hypothetical protein
LFGLNPVYEGDGDFDEGLDQCQIGRPDRVHFASMPEQARDRHPGPTLTTAGNQVVVFRLRKLRQ